MDSLLSNQKSMVTSLMFSIIIRALLIALCSVLLCILLGETVLNTGEISSNSDVLAGYRQKDSSFAKYILAIPIVALGAVFFLRDFIEVIKIHKAFKRITKNTYTYKKITFEKIRCLTTKAGRHSKYLRGFVLTDIYGHIYYYILSDKLFVTFRDKLSIEETLETDILGQDLEVPCYEGTNIIRELKLDMYKHSADIRH